MKSSNLQFGCKILILNSELLSHIFFLYQHVLPAGYWFDKVTQGSAESSITTTVTCTAATADETSGEVPLVNKLLQGYSCYGELLISYLPLPDAICFISLSVMVLE